MTDHEAKEKILQLAQLFGSGCPEIATKDDALELAGQIVDLLPAALAEAAREAAIGELGPDFLAEVERRAGSGRDEIMKVASDRCVGDHHYRADCDCRNVLATLLRRILGEGDAL